MGVSVSALLAQGFAHHRVGAVALAAGCYRAILAIEPGHADSLHLLGLIAHRDGDHDAAIASIGRAIALRPAVAVFHLNLGIAWAATATPARAQACFEQAIRLQPDNADALYNLGALLLRLDRPAAAEPCLRAAIRLTPEAADAHATLGISLLRLGQRDEAAAALRTALRLRPDTPGALSGLGTVLAELGRAEEAEASYRGALRLAPADPVIWNNLGNLLRDLGRFDEAESVLREALRLRPDRADTHSNLGNVLVASGRLADAEACYRAALRLDPLHADTHYNLGTAHLLAGRLAEGWKGFEWRWRRRGFAPPQPFAQPQWTGAPTGDRVLLLHAEQGVGDSIQMARFIPAIAARHRVVLQVQPALLRLFSALPGVERIVARGDVLPPFNLHCPLMSLPGVLGVTLETIPSGSLCLAASPDAVAGWRRGMDGLAPRRVGIAWAGNQHYPADARRSMAPDRLAPLADLPGIAFVSLQKGAPAPPWLHDWTAELTDFFDTAALIEALDLVISVDTAVAHLAGALGKPVWLLNRSDPCWRWMLGRDDSPWYPTLRQFRQTSAGDWDGVIQDVRSALEEQGSALHPLATGTPLRADSRQGP